MQRLGGTDRGNEHPGRDRIPGRQRHTAAAKRDSAPNYGLDQDIPMQPRPIHEALTADQASLDVTHTSITYAHGRGCYARGEEKPGAIVEVHGLPAHVS